ncbi:MAG: prenyltransferase/squalene oxidase repeat-containing protein [Gemmataceae bacterium]
MTRTVMVFVAVACLFASAGAALAQDGESRIAQARKAVERSLPFIEKEGVAWMKKQKCVSCHHIPMMVWALSEARNRGYRSDEKVLVEVTRWATTEENYAQVFPVLPLDAKRSETDYLGPLLMALALAASPDHDEATEKARQQFLARAVSQQANDGSWDANRGGRPPIHAAQEVQTSWVFLALGGKEIQPEAKDRWRRQRKAAADWLSQNLPAENPQALAMRLLIYERLGKPAEDAKNLVESLLQLQNTDGGWSQTKEMNSDAFATGLSLYALSAESGVDSQDAVNRGQAFLIKTQQADGSWPMSSRPAEPRGPGPARNLGPIRYFATSWATIGLARSAPATK